MDAAVTPHEPANVDNVIERYAAINRKLRLRLAAILGGVFLAVNAIAAAVFQNLWDMVAPLALGGCALGALAMAFVDPVASLLRGPAENVAGFYVHRLNVTALGAKVGTVTSIVLVARNGRQYKLAVPEAALDAWLVALRSRFPQASESPRPGRVDVPFAPFAAFLGVWAAWALPIAMLAGTARNHRHHHAFDAERANAPAYHYVAPACNPPAPPTIQVALAPPRPPAVTAAQAGRRIDAHTPINVGQTVRAEWHGSWYLAEVLANGPGGVQVHYAGESHATDETVVRSRIRIPER